VGQEPKSAPSKLMICGNDSGMQGGKSAKQNKCQVILDEEESDLLNNIEDRVQGLSRNEIFIFEDDLISNEGQGSQPSKDGSSLQVGLVKCPNIVAHREEIRDVEKEVLLEISKSMHMDGEALPRELVISDRQRLPETRCSSRLEQRLVSKTLTNQAGKKMVAEGNMISTHNSFAALDNECIASLASEMGINIAPDQFESINIIKVLEIVRQALDRSKLIEPPINEEIEVVNNVECVEVGNLIERIKKDSELDSSHLSNLEKKKKRQLKKSLENSGMKNPLRRSSRTTPSIYRGKGCRKILPQGIGYLRKVNDGCEMIILEL
jgi:hypothetical protein